MLEDKPFTDWAISLVHNNLQLKNSFPAPHVFLFNQGHRRWHQCIAKQLNAIWRQFLYIYIPDATWRRRQLWDAHSNRRALIKQMSTRKKKNLESKLMLRSGMKQIGDRFLSTAWVIILALSIISEPGFPGLEEVLVELCDIVPIRSCIVNAKPDTIQVSHHLLASQVQKALCRTFC